MDRAHSRADLCRLVRTDDRVFCCRILARWCISHASEIGRSGVTPPGQGTVELAATRDAEHGQRATAQRQGDRRARQARYR